MISLVKEAQQGNEDAFVQLMDMYRQMLYRVAISITHNEEDALDAMSETILSCWEKVPTLKNPKYFKTWMTKILINKCYDQIRMQSRYVNMEQVEEPWDEIDVDSSIHVKDTMQSLAKSDQLILGMFYFDDFSVKQIAELLSISKSAVKTRLNRSRNRFKNQYEERGKRHDEEKQQPVYEVPVKRNW